MNIFYPYGFLAYSNLSTMLITVLVLKRKHLSYSKAWILCENYFMKKKKKTNHYLSYELLLGPNKTISITEQRHKTI